MIKNDMDSVFVRLCQHLQNNKKKNRKNVTVLIGAGCSLSSSDKKITTQYILTDLVKRHAYGRPIPDNWDDLMRAFDSWVWEGRGHRDKIELLEEYFEGMEPATGYRNLRFLVENGYINNILTTNFDLMIDEVLEGLSYNLIVGNVLDTQIGDDPQFTLIKSHGDLKHGGLLFASNELKYLSTPLAKRIREMTSSILLVAGYSAQDASILSSFDTTAGYGAFWATYHEPDRSDVSKTKAMFELLKNRGSDSNLLYGNKYGDFDALFDKLVSEIKDAESPSFTAFIDIWSDSVINGHLTGSRRFMLLQKNLLVLLQQQTSNSIWKVTAPYYAVSQLNLLEAAIGHLHEAVLPSSILEAVRNEVEALLLSLSIVAWTACQGYAFTPESLINQLRKSFEEQHNSPIIKSDFWKILTWLVEVDLTRQQEYNSRYHEIQIAFDKEEDYTAVLKRIDIYRLSDILRIVQQLLFFTKTASPESQSNSLIGHSLKHKLESHLYKVAHKSDIVHVEINGIPQRVYNQIYEHFLKHLFRAHDEGKRISLSASNMLVDVFLDMSETTSAGTLWENLCSHSVRMTEEYLNGFVPAEYAELRSVDILNNFADSSNSGLFITGDSGSGKTILLKQWIDSLDKTNCLVIPLRGSNEDGNRESGPLAFSEFLIEENLEAVNTTMAQHNQSLILVFDGLNEIKGRFKCIESYYKKLLDFCECLFQKECDNIRLIITCRTEFYQELKRSSSVTPRPGCFYSIIEQDKENEILSLPPLSSCEVESLLSFFHKDKSHQLFKGDNILNEFGDIARSPLYLNLLSQTMLNSKSNTKRLTRTEIFNNWFGYILEQAAIEQIDSDTIREIVRYGVVQRYFKAREDKLTTNQMSRTLHHISPNALGVYDWLAEKGVFNKKTLPPNRIQYAHDSIEEYFLQGELLKLDSHQLKELDQVLCDDCLEQTIVQRTVQSFFEYLFFNDRLQFINMFIPVCQKEHPWLAGQMYRTILSISLNSGAEEEILQFYKSIEHLLLKKEYIHHIQWFLLALESDIQEGIDPGKIIVDVMHRISNQPNCRQEISVPLLGCYISAKYAFYFANENDESPYKNALQLCSSAKERCNESTPLHLRDKINSLFAIIKRSMGEINEAIAIMETILEHQKQENLSDAVCSTVIELGALYRDMTRFDEALALYQSIDTNLVENKQLVHWLLIQQGIIYKNKIQNAFFDGINTEEIIADYHLCNEYFIETYNYAKQTNNIILVLEALLELIEATEAGYRLNQCTISQVLEWSEQLNKEIVKYPTPLYKAQYYRVQARVYALQERLDEAIDLLTEGFDFASKYDFRYRATDCCNIITGIISDNLANEDFITRERLEQGLFYGKYAINYYEQLDKENNRYLDDSKQKYNAIKDYADRQYSALNQ